MKGGEVDPVVAAKERKTHAMLQVEGALDLGCPTERSGSRLEETGGRGAGGGVLIPL